MTTYDYDHNELDEYSYTDEYSETSETLELNETSILASPSPYFEYSEDEAEAVSDEEDKDDNGSETGSDGKKTDSEDADDTEDADDGDDAGEHDDAEDEDDEDKSISADDKISEATRKLKSTKKNVERDITRRANKEKAGGDRNKRGGKDRKGGSGRGGGGRGGRDRSGGRSRREEERLTYWEPRTKLGHMVQSSEITTMAQAIETRLPLKEPEIVDILIPELEDEVLDVNMVQRMTDSGRRVQFSITTVVGNKDGYVGLGHAKGREVGPAIRKAIDNAKLHIIQIRRGCGSWECGCGTPHTFPFAVLGKASSVEVGFKPSPRGISLAVGDIAKVMLRLAGIKDAWGYTNGQTRTTINYAKAVFDALKQTSKQRITPAKIEELKVIKGSVQE